MLTSQDKTLLSRLIKKYAEKIPTEAMIAFAADNNGMLDVCKSLVRKNKKDDRETMAWVDEQCHACKVDVRSFLFEISQIVSVFQPDIKGDEHYAILGLEIGADKKEIKSAYKKLSLQYHPDTSVSGRPEDANIFIEITKAYHALLSGGKEEREDLSPEVPPAPWREQPKNRLSWESKKKNILWFAVLALGMIVISLVAANGYKKKAMLVGLQNSRLAMIPPDAVIEQGGKIRNNQVESEVMAIANVSELMEVERPVLQEKEESAEKSIITEQYTPEKRVETTPVGQASVSLEKNVQQASATPATTVKKIVKSAKAYQKKLNITPDPAPVITRKNDTAEMAEIAEISKTQQDLVESGIQQVSAHPTRKEIQVNTQERIESFLAAYIEAYEKKNFLDFSRFFSLKATENDKPLVEIMPTYIQLFQDADSISLTVTILKWKQIHQEVIIDGRFTINIEYHNSSKVSGKGEISFLLADLQQQLLIRELRYKFDKH